MRTLGATLAALLLSTSALALPPANNAVTLQPTDIRDWVCNFHAPVTVLISKTVTVRAGSDATPAGLVSTPTIGTTCDPTVAGSCAAFRIDATGRTSGTVYQVDIVAADSGGQRFTCNGKVTVQTMKVVI